MTTVQITKAPDDPICTRVSCGGDARVGYYLVYRGKIGDALKILEDCLHELKKMEEREGDIR